MIVKFYFADAAIKLSDRRRLKQFLNKLFMAENILAASLTYVFCSDEYLISINREFLNHDTYTDIVTFCLSEDKEPIVGEIYISTERVLENAGKLKVDLNRELHRVIFHGALHLCGLRDKSAADKREMRKEEDKYLQLYFE